MSLLQTPRDRAVALIFGLAAFVALALAPFFSGLLGALVLSVTFGGTYRRLARTLKPGLAASLILVVALAVIALPAAWLIGLVIDQGPDALRRVQGSDVLARVSQLRVGSVQVGAELAKASGTLVSWLSGQIISFAGGATSVALNLLIAFFGFYYMLRSRDKFWEVLRSYIPFSPRTAEALRNRFINVTQATLLGTALVAVAQGTLVGLGFLVVDLPNALFWGAVTAFASVLPVLGSALVWLPAVVVLLTQQRYAAAEERLRDYLLKGGFLWVDDFWGAPLGALAVRDCARAPALGVSDPGRALQRSGVQDPDGRRARSADYQHPVLAIASTAARRPSGAPTARTRTSASSAIARAGSWW